MTTEETTTRGSAGQKKAPLFKVFFIAVTVLVVVGAVLLVQRRLKKWYHDIGTTVQKGELLADIDTPEVDQQLGQARADLNTSKANSQLSEITAARYSELLKTDGVSKQEVDNALGDLAAKRAMVQSSEANVRRLEDLESFKRIYAPFSGVITQRNIDI